MWTLEMTGIRHSFGFRNVLDGVSHQGGPEVLGISGSNGSGKSTLMRILAGLIRPDSGSVVWKRAGVEVDPARIRESAGFSSPTLGLYPELSVRENLELVARLRRVRIGEVDTWIGTFGLTEAANRAVGRCSTGQQQRTRLATAWLHQPDILFLDEPGSNLDSSGMALLGGLVQRHPGFVILATNDRQELAWCRTVISL